MSKQHIIDRFLRYVKIDTQSDPSSNTTPSTEKQWNLAYMLAEELKEIGMKQVTIDDNGYIMATLPSNVEQAVPIIGFISHFDTSPDFSGSLSPLSRSPFSPQLVPVTGRPTCGTTLASEPPRNPSRRR